MIKSLAYVGFNSPAADEWRTFGTEVLGAQLVDGTDNTVAFRVDEHAPRLMIHAGVQNDLAYIGWDCGDAAGIAEVVDKLQAAGIATEPDQGKAEARHVEDLVAFTDPFGMPHELTYGLATAGAFLPGREIAGFNTGEQGLGHLVCMFPNLDEAMDFFTGTLGFLVSDHIEAGLSLRFLHCNSRHHTLALSEVPGHVGVHHLMLELNDPDDVGRALDIVNEREIPLAMTLGRHTNDLMTSFYVRTPSGFEIEYGSGGIAIDDSTWEVVTHHAMSLWGHKPPTERLMPGILRRVATPS